MKNMLILFLSETHANSKTIEYKIFRKDTGKESIKDFEESDYYVEPIKAKETNEPYVKYLLRKFKNDGKGEQLDYIYILLSNKVKKLKKLDGDEINDYGLFKRMVEQECKDLEFKDMPDFNPIDYNEDKMSDEAAFESVLKLSQMLQDDLNNDKINPDEMNVFLDISGGMRDTALLMTAILRLIEFQGLTINEIKYANYIKENTALCHLADSTDIFRLYDLIAGAEEFTSFGSVENLQNYYKNRHTSSELGDLLNAMERFSKDLKLCAFGRFDQTVQKLKTAIDDFSMKADKTEDDKIFDILVKRIKKEYDLILKDEADLLDYMGWCLANDYIQQALTIVSENLSDYIVEKKILYPSKCLKENGEWDEESHLVKKCIEQNNNDKKYWASWTDAFLSNYKSWKKNNCRALKWSNVKCFIKDIELETIINIRHIIRKWRNGLNHSNVLIMSEQEDVALLEAIREETKVWRDVDQDSIQVKMGYELTYHDIVEQLKEWHRYLNSVLKK